MTNTYYDVLSGDRLSENAIPEQTAEANTHPFVVFQDQRTGQQIGLNTAALSKAVALTGNPGTGKTNTLLMMTYGLMNILRKGDGNLFFFDTKGDFYREFHNALPRNQIIVIGPGAEYRDTTAYHNLFAEIMRRDETGTRLIYEGEDSDERAAEITEHFFEDMDSQTQPIFPAMAKEIVKIVICAFMRRYGAWPDRKNPKENQSMLNNRRLQQYFHTISTEELRALFDSPLLCDFKGAKSYIAKDSNQTQGVESYIRASLDRMLVGPFAKADPKREFSMREIVTQCSGKMVFIEYELSANEHLSPYYALMIDQALKHSLGGRAQNRKDQCFILDEYTLLPKLSYLSRALSFGRSQGVQIIAAFQNINQLYARYGQYEARNMLSSFQSMIAFASTDPETRQYLSERFGDNYVNITFQPLSSTEPIHVQRIGHSVEDTDLTHLEDGEAVVSLVRSRPFLFHFPLYKPPH